MCKRDLHTLSVKNVTQETRISLQEANENNIVKGKINPYYISGFIDAEGCFSVLCIRSEKMKSGLISALAVKIIKAYSPKFPAKN